MRDDLDDILCKKYPKIFADRHKSMMETCMYWGFDIGDGWYPIIDNLCNNIQQYIDWQNRDEVKVPQVVASQVKEKYGGLRFYYDGGDDYIDGMVRMAESWAESTCEQCGKPAKLRGKSWLYTACDEHNKETNLKEETHG